MTNKGIRTIAYLVKSQYPWMPGKAILSPIPLPAWEKSYASEANVAIMKMMNYDAR